MKYLTICSILILLISCKKDNANSIQENNFFLRNEISSNSYNKINKGITTDTTLNKTIEHFKDFDNKAGIVNKITSEFGLPIWDLSFTMKDKNGLYTTFTPIVNSADSVTALIIASEKNKKTTFFRIIDRKIPQNKLVSIGDKNANSFTLYSLNGIFETLQKNVKIYKNTTEVVENTKIKSNSISINSINKNQVESITYTTCWLYVSADENYNTIIQYQCITNTIYFEIGGVEGSGSNYLTPTYTGYGGVSLSNRELNIDQSLISNLIGPTPIKVFKSICNGVNSMWNNYPNNETHGYITMDGQIILTNITSFNGGNVAGLYQYENLYYYSYPKSGGDLGITGTRTTSDYYLIPVMASIHTHSPCRIDNTDGVSDRPVSNDDSFFAQKYPGLINYVVGCGAIANFSDSNSEYFDIKMSNQTNLCNFILK